MGSGSGRSIRLSLVSRIVDEPEIGARDVALNRIEDGFDELQVLVSDLIADDSQAAIQPAVLPSDRIIANWPDRDELVVDLLGELVDELCAPV